MYMIKLSIQLSILLAILIAIWSRGCQHFIQSLVVQALSFITLDAEVITKHLILANLPVHDMAGSLSSSGVNETAVKLGNHESHGSFGQLLCNTALQSMLPLVWVAVRRVFR